MKPETRDLAFRLLSLALLVLAVPGVIALGALSEDTAVVVDEPSPRTIVADRQVEVVDDLATAEARQRAANLVPAVEVPDLDASSGMVAAVGEVFAAARAVREPRLQDNPDAGQPDEPAQVRVVPSPAQQVEQLTRTIPALGEDGVRDLVGLSDAQLDRVEAEAIDVMQALAQRQILQDELGETLDRELPLLIGLRQWPDEVDQTIVEPLLREVAQPTWVVDNEATEEQRQEAFESVEEVTQAFAEGAIVVSAGDRVSEVEFEAIDELGQVGSRPGVALLRALLVMLVTVGVMAGYVRRMRPQTWKDGARLLVLSSLVTVGAVVVVIAKILSDAYGVGWWFTVPVGGLALLASVLAGSVSGLVIALPLAVMAVLVAPQLPGLAVFVVAVTVLAAPLAEGIATRVGLRRATMRMAVASPLLAAVAAVVFGPRDAVIQVIIAAGIGGLAGFGLVQSLLPAYENVFRLATVTSLLELADRNHPLLRELEAKALGSYNHSVMVASLTERACREIGANELLGQVSALYHDIGKVRQPHFFIENQRGIANPHDELEPRVSAVIIQNHVKDGVEMATEHRLPPDVVDCIGSHHGTMVVSYFYNQAVKAADGDEGAVDEDHFRYKGHRPRSKEAAVLLLADCCEATTRAMAMDRGTLPSDLIEQTVDRLLGERLEDGQFDDCDLTFVELRAVRASIVEALTGVYHPRIAYPPRDES